MGPALTIAVSSVAQGLVSTLIFYAYGKSARKSKSVAKPAWIAGAVSAAVTAGLMVANYYAAGSAAASTSGLGRLGIHSAMQEPRLGIYMPAPTVKKFSSFTGVRYYS